MQWLRLWVDAVDDEKLMLLAFEDRWHFVAILCLKRKGILDVDEPPALRDRKVAAKLGVDARTADEIRRRLMEVDLVDEHWQPHGWSNRQFASDVDSTATERKQRQRDRERHGPVTRDSRASHTAQSQIQSTDTESEKKEEGEVRAKRSPTATRLPVDFALIPERRTIAEAEKVDAEREFAKFVDHWRAASGAKARKVDWEATWRNWCRNAVDYAPRTRAPPKPPWVPPKSIEQLEAEEREQQRSA